MGSMNVSICLNFITLHKLDATDIAVNLNLIAAVVENNGLAKILINNEWIELNISKKQLFFEIENFLTT